MTATEPCVSLSTGTLSPDQRVNYSYGMVLGLDEFLQEQLYLQEKDYRLRRTLHGFGTSYGLNVTVARPADSTIDFTVAVSPGAGIDQWGREFVLREAQCIRLLPWVLAQEQAQPGIVTAHGDGCGDVPVYVVASYATCLDALVPLPGQTCGGDQSQVPSRIRDSWNIELRWDPPAMPRWDSDRRLGRLLASTVLVDEYDPALPDENALIDAVRALPAQAPNGPGDIDQSQPSEIPVVYQVSRERALATWDQIFAIWVSEIRPQLEPDLLAPPESSDPAILLGAVRFSTGVWPPFNPADPDLFSANTFDPGRPTVLNTQLIQELPSPYATPSEPIELVTLVPSAPTASAFTIDAWFHLDRPVTLVGPVQVVTESGASAAFTVTAKNLPSDPPNFANVWTLTPPAGVKFTTGQQLRVLFGSDSVLIGGNSTLNRWREENGSRFLNTTPTGGDVLAYTTVTGPTVVSTLAGDAQPSLSSAVTPAPVAAVTGAEFVTITDTGATDQQLSFELWFHPEPRGARDDMIAETPQVRAFDELTGNPLTVSGLTQDPLYGNVWTVTTEVPPNNRPFPAYVRFVFPAEGFGVASPTSGSTGLADWIGSGGIEFTGWDPGDSSIVAFHRVAAPDDAGPEPEPAAEPAAKRVTRTRTAAAKAASGRSQKR
ncbi:hypothetical protein OG407_49745 [Streptomyces sp. NBC_01515]|uniref:hypothetical protein n=1 Tax=Streptomyces sp. NBC_01515 TaxID=2903890 RepID=UPI00386F5E90